MSNPNIHDLRRQLGHSSRQPAPTPVPERAAPQPVHRSGYWEIFSNHSSSFMEFLEEKIAGPAAITAAVMWAIFVFCLGMEVFSDVADWWMFFRIVATLVVTILGGVLTGLALLLGYWALGLAVFLIGHLVCAVIAAFEYFN